MSDPFKECLDLCDKIGRDLDDCSDMVREMNLSLDRIKDNLDRTVFLIVAGSAVFVVAVPVILAIGLNLAI